MTSPTRLSRREWLRRAGVGAGGLVIAGCAARSGGGEGVLYMFPRSDGILLGGTFERGAAHLTADADTTARIVREHARLAGAMRGAI